MFSSLCTLLFLYLFVPAATGESSLHAAPALARHVSKEERSKKASKKEKTRKKKQRKTKTQNKTKNKTNKTTETSWNVLRLHA